MCSVIKYLGTVCRGNSNEPTSCSSTNSGRVPSASGSCLDLIRAPYVLYGVKCIDPASLATISGEVWKGLLSDGNYSNIPEYIVAAKTVKESSDAEGAAAAESELMKEALLMAQVKQHTNLVSIIGVITRGWPKTLVCDYASLLRLECYSVFCKNKMGK